jgi:hypothetical protein
MISRALSPTLIALALMAPVMVAPYADAQTIVGGNCGRHGRWRGSSDCPG